MKNISDKAKIIVGWLLLVLGLFIIGYSLLSAYQVFKGYPRREAPQIFAIRKFAQVEEVGEVNQIHPDPLGLDIVGMMAGVLEGILPIEHIPIFLNIGVFTIFIFILITGGFKISTLGIKLLFNEKA